MQVVVTKIITNFRKETSLNSSMYYSKLLQSNKLFIPSLTRPSFFVCSFHRELSAVGVKVINPYGGFYIMPDFEIIRSALEKRGVTTGNEMCQLMFEEKSIAVSNQKLFLCQTLYLSPHPRFYSGGIYFIHWIWRSPVIFGVIDSYQYP